MSSVCSIDDDDDDDDDDDGRGGNDHDGDVDGDGDDNALAMCPMMTHSLVRSITLCSPTVRDDVDARAHVRAQ